MATKVQSENNKKSGGILPFWAPWGAMGCLWRTLLFLLGAALLSWLFSLMLNGCGGRENQPGDNLPPEVYRDMDSIIDNDRQLPPPLQVPDSIPPYEDRDKAPVVEPWNDSIPNVPELPAPDDNRIAPIDSTRIIVNPSDSLSQIVGGELTVFFNSKDVKTDMTRFAQRFKQLYPSNAYSVSYYNPAAGSMLLTVPQTEEEAVASRLEEQITDIDFIVTTNEVMRSFNQPSDPMFKAQYAQEYLGLIQAFEAWDITKGSPDVKVAVVDSYFDLSNPEIGTRVESPIHIPSKTRAVLPPDRSPMNDGDYGVMSHGSHVAGIAVGAHDNNLGLGGIAPECTLIPVALGDQMSKFNVIEGILYAIYAGADVVNVSIGKAYPEGLAKVLPLQDQVDYAKTQDKRSEALWEYVGKVAADHNCVIVTAAGNETLMMGMDSMKRPSNMIKVEAVDAKGIASDFTNYGKVPESQIDYSTVAAPGVALWSSIPRKAAAYIRGRGGEATLDGFGSMNGTSMASPVVAGAVALLKSKNKDLTAEQIIDILVRTAKQTDTQHRIGPTIQLADALRAAGGEKMNFDEVTKDPDKIIGRWKSTHEINLVNEGTGAKLDEMWTYFVFTSPTEGTIEYHLINSKKVATAPLRVSIGNNRIDIVQLRNATGDGENINKDDFVCTPDENRLLKASVRRNGKERYTMYLEKVN